ncbi:gp022 [Rhodococcus phage ReqiPoco6]|uniref:Gp022 n=1 Tax=Rhodococcus phage ReqiPoco6 TaxID=691964 RepID=D4P7P0_9CAUD|nr:gp022 [Rhodococcus phage ReqiPoco6]ADD81020.1 gp022 [Rhodococcus phage ReqiPoco6]
MGVAMDDSIDNFLAHYGVKGMKWGQRKKHKESKKEYKARTKKELAEYNEKKAFSIASRAAVGKENVIVKTKFGGDTHGSIVTGEQFYQQLARGRAFDIRITEIYATRKAEGEQFTRAALYPAYQKSERR